MKNILCKVLGHWWDKSDVNFYRCKRCLSNKVKIYQEVTGKISWELLEWPDIK